GLRHRMQNGRLTLVAVLSDETRRLFWTERLAPQHALPLPTKSAEEKASCQSRDGHRSSSYYALRGVSYTVTRSNHEDRDIASSHVNLNSCAPRRSWRKIAISSTTLPGRPVPQ